MDTYTKIFNIISVAKDKKLFFFFNRIITHIPSNEPNVVDNLLQSTTLEICMEKNKKIYIC